MKNQTDLADLCSYCGACHGVGSITANRRTFDEITYFIEISQLGNGVRRTQGMIDAKLAVLEQISRSEQSTLTLETREQVPIIVAQVLAGHAEIRIVGPMPASVVFFDIDCPDQNHET